MRVYICRNLHCRTLEWVSATDEWCPGCGQYGQYSQTLENGKAEFLETLDTLHAAIAEAQAQELLGEQLRLAERHSLDNLTHVVVYDAEQGWRCEGHNSQGECDWKAVS